MRTDHQSKLGSIQPQVYDRDHGVEWKRPILFTVATTALRVWPITLDPIVSGPACTLIFGLRASRAFTLVVIPVAY